MCNVKNIKCQHNQIIIQQDVISLADQFKAVHIRLQCLVQQGVEQALLGIVPCSETRLQPITQCHQFIHFGDDAMLFGEGWAGEMEVSRSQRH